MCPSHLHKNIPQHKSNLVEPWYYKNSTTIFITIGKHSQKNTFGAIRNGKINLNDLGIIAQKCWDEIPSQFPFVQLIEFDIRPNQVKALVNLNLTDVFCYESFHETNDELATAKTDDDLMCETFEDNDFESYNNPFTESNLDILNIPIEEMFDNYYDNSNDDLFNISINEKSIDFNEDSYFEINESLCDVSMNDAPHNPFIESIDEIIEIPMDEMLADLFETHELYDEEINELFNENIEEWENEFFHDTLNDMIVIPLDKIFADSVDEMLMEISNNTNEDILDYPHPNDDSEIFSCDVPCSMIFDKMNIFDDSLFKNMNENKTFLLDDTLCDFSEESDLNEYNNALQIGFCENVFDEIDQQMSSENSAVFFENELLNPIISTKELLSSIIQKYKLAVKKEIQEIKPNFEWELGYDHQIVQNKDEFIRIINCNFNNSKNQ